MTVRVDERVDREKVLSRAIGAAAVVVMAGNLSSSVLGWARGSITASVFGLKHLDGFAAASLVPQMFYDLTIGAAISAALIPTFAELAQRNGPRHLADSVGAVIGLLWVVLTILIVGVVAGATAVLPLFLNHHLLTGSLHTAALVRLITPAVFFLGTSAVFLSTLYSLRRFTVAAFASCFYHLGIIFGAIFLARPLGVLALAVGAVAGAAAQALIQVPSVVRAIGRPRIRVAFTPEVRTIIRLYLPVAAGVLISIGGQILDLTFKSNVAQHDPGAIQAMVNATTLVQFPIGITVAALGFAVLPTISLQAAAGHMDDFKRTLAAGMRLVLFLTIPAALGYIALATPVTAAIYERGQTGPVGAAEIATALSGYAIQIPFVGIDQLLIFSFYARKNTVTPMLVGVLGVGIYVAGALILMPRLHIFGLALANTIQNSLHALILLFLLLSSVGVLRGARMLPGICTTLAAGAVMWIGTIATYRFLDAVLKIHSSRAYAAETVIPIFVAAALYIGVAWLLRSEDLALVVDLAGKKLRGSGAQSTS